MQLVEPTLQIDLDIDSRNVLYALGILFAAGAFVYFIRDVVFGLSITLKALLLFGAFVGFLVAGIAVQRDVLDVVRPLDRGDTNPW